MDGEPGKPSPAAAAETIFIAALALSPSERPAGLAKACGDNAELRRRVEALLRAHEAPESFLPEQPRAAIDPVGHVLSAANQSVFVTEQPGDTIPLRQ